MVLEVRTRWYAAHTFSAFLHMSSAMLMSVSPAPIQHLQLRSKSIHDQHVGQRPQRNTKTYPNPSAGILFPLFRVKYGTFGVVVPAIVY